MWCRYHGRTCIMVIEKGTGKPRFIREKRWFAMSDRETERYIW